MFVEEKTIPRLPIIAPVWVPSTPNEVCLAAADYMEKHGWTQRPYYTERVCIITAIGRVTPSSELRQKAVRLVKKVIGPLIVSWNEQPERTEAQVVAMLRAAASEK